MCRAESVADVNVAEFAKRFAELLHVLVLGRHLLLVGANHAAFLFQMVAAQAPKVLIFSATLGFRHESIPTAITELQKHGPEYGVTFENTEDPASFNATFLNQYDAIMFLMNTDDKTEPIMSDAQAKAFQTWLDDGGNFIGIHAAAYCLQTHEFYEKELGAYFEGHPALAPATFLKLEPNHPTVNMLPDRWTFREEVYNFQSDPRRHGAKVVLTVDHDSDEYAEKHGDPHPIAWYQEKGSGADPNGALVGRSFYSSLGHMNSTWKEPLFMAHIMAGVTWVMDGETTRAYNNQAKVGYAAGYGVEKKRPGSSSTSSGAAAAATESAQVNAKDENKNAGQASFSLTWSAVFVAVATSLLFIHGQ